MHVVILNYVYEPGFQGPQDLLARYFTLKGWVQGLCQAGAQVTVLQRFRNDEIFEMDGAAYHLVQDRYGPGLRYWQVPLRLHRIARQVSLNCLAAGEDVVLHFNGLIFPLQLQHMRAALPPACGLAVQHHAERPPAGFKRWFWRQRLSAADGFLFAARELAQGWLESDLIAERQMLYEVMEASSGLSFMPRAQARQISGMQGNPILFWAGNLDENKDPLTVLAGFEQALVRLPQARLYMAYRSDTLLPQVEHCIAGSPALSQSVTLLGNISYERIGAYYNSADFFCAGQPSRRKWGGFAGRLGLRSGSGGDRYSLISDDYPAG